MFKLLVASTCALLVLTLAGCSAEEEIPARKDNIIGRLEAIIKRVGDMRHNLQDPKWEIPEKFTKIGQRFYYIEETQKASWYTALSICCRMGGHLATFQSEEELSAVDPLLHIRDKGYWIDGNDLDREGIFLSWTTGNPSPYLKWKEGEPNNLHNKEHCVDLWNGRMNDDDCTDKRYFICQARDGI